MSEVRGERPSGASRAPRHQRADPLVASLDQDPFELPDPVEDQLRRWRIQRATEASAGVNGVELGHSALEGSAGHPIDPVTSSCQNAGGRATGDAALTAPGAHADETILGRLPRGHRDAAGIVPPGGGVEPRRYRDGSAAAMSDRGDLAYKPQWTLDGAQVKQPASDVPVAANDVSAATVHPNAVTEATAAGGWPVSGRVTVEELTPEMELQSRMPARAKAGTALAIEAKNLKKSFKSMVAVEDVSFSVPAGSIVALLGPNGAGKTTLVNMLCTLLKPDGGSATVNGHDVAREAAAVRESIMLTGQFAALDEALTGRENLVLFGRLLGLSKAAARDRADELLDAFSLTDVAGKRVREYSGGMRRRIDIACGLVTAPRVVFLDEPTTGLDPRSRQEVWALVEQLRDSGVSILLTTQYLEEADVLSDHIVVIDKGRVIAEGTSDDLKASTGSAYCEVTPADPADLPRLRDVLSDLLDDAPPERDGYVVAVPAPNGAQTLVEVVRRTAEADIPLSDVSIRRPSLDEVFLALTDPRRDRKSL